MAIRIGVLGHLLHPTLVAFPLAMFGAAVLFDIGYLLTANEDLAAVTFWAIAVGIVGGLAGAVIDGVATARGIRADGVRRVPGAGNAIVVMLFVISWLLRGRDATDAPDALPAVLAFAGAAVALGSAWFGGEFVDRLRAAVEDEVATEPRRRGA